MGMTVYNPDGTVASVFQGIKRDGNKLVLKQLALGQIPMDVIITPEEGLKSLSMGMSLGLLSFILLFPYFYFSYRGEKRRRLQLQHQTSQRLDPAGRHGYLQRTSALPLTISQGASHSSQR